MKIEHGIISPLPIAFAMDKKSLIIRHWAKVRDLKRDIVYNLIIYR